MHNLPRTALTLSIGLAAGCAAALAHPAEPVAAIDADVAQLRARGPAALDALLGRYDHLSPGAERDRLAETIDAVAAQRHATTSRLYWYTDLASAQAAARALDRPILALRMLGRLDEELSCANSRLFRATLYANAEVSRFLRDQFVLFWSSERAVPRVTIDFGDGRKLERTTTGNSAHYVLDAAGNVLDALPGLYAPAVFRAELAKSIELARRVATLDDGGRAAALRKHHTAELAAGAAQFGRLAGTPYTPGRGPLVPKAQLASSVAKAQRATMAKAMVEVSDLARIGIDAGSVDAADVAAWATVGQRLWGFEPGRVLDARSRALVASLHNGGPVKASRRELDAVIARLEQSIVADTALNQLQLRAQIRTAIIRDERRTFPQLNAWIYANVFHTPKADAWLGLLSRTDFSGLPGDGVVMP